MRNSLQRWLGLGVLAMLAACAGNPADEHERNPDLSRFDEQCQQQDRPFDEECQQRSQRRQQDSQPPLNLPGELNSPRLPQAPVNLNRL